MMDGRIGAVRDALDAEGYTDVGIIGIMTRPGIGTLASSDLFAQLTRQSMPLPSMGHLETRWIRILGVVTRRLTLFVRMFP